MSPLLSHLSTTLPILAILCAVVLHLVRNPSCPVCDDRGVTRACRPGTQVGAVVDCPACGPKQLPELQIQKRDRR